MSATPAWRLEVLGSPRLVGVEGPRRLDRRTAALLAYLALEGPQPRSRVAGLLWPDVREATARANLRQLVRRLREVTATDLLGAADPITLTDALEVDVVVAPDAPGELLDGLEIDDADELTTWLTDARAALQRRRQEAALGAAAQAEEAGRWPEAITAAQRAVDLDPLSEAAHRQLMRAHYLAGDRAAASAAFTRCRIALRDRLGIEPSRATTQLADEIARGRRGLTTPAAAPPRIPITVLRPPVLAGRAREWALLEEAWAAGKSIMLGGPPGVGKSRLMSEFLALHGRAIVAAGRPLDRTVPYGTHARTYRELVDVVGKDRLPPWVVRELARLIPALGDAPGALTSAEDRLRFWSAKIEAHRIAQGLGYDVFALDDLQYVDEASAEAGGYVLMQLKSDPERPLRTFHSYRTGELPAATLAIIQAAADAGVVLHLVLEPLPADALAALLDSLAIPGLDALADDILRYTGGNPQLVLETVRHLVETGGLTGEAPPRIGLGERVGALLAARLARLTPPALELARVLAVLGTEFTLERAADALEVTAPGLAPAWEELVAAQIVRGEAFAHDLLGEAVIAGTPAPVARLLHRRAAEVLDDDAGASARILTHLLDAGEDALASATRPRVLEEARQALLEDEVRRYFGEPLPG